MREKRIQRFAGLVCCAALMLSQARALPAANRNEPTGAPPAASHRAPVLGADLLFANSFSPLIDAWQHKDEGDEMAAAFALAGLRSLRFSSHGFYSARGQQATEQVKAENKLTNQFPWFALDDYANFIATHDFTTVFGVNVEEGPQAAYDAVQTFLSRGLQSKLVAVELSNEPWLNYRPWQPEEYAAHAADVIERLTPLGVRFALPLTVGNDNNTPTKLTDTVWNTRMMQALTQRVDLKNRADIYGVLHLYSRGMNGKSVDAFNKIVRPFAPQMRYLITEFNIRLTLQDNPHLTNKYAMEFARKLADVMSRPEIEAMYIHGVPYHSILYWANRKGRATVSGTRDERLKGEALSRGWHLTPTGRVYSLYSRLAWNGEVIEYHDGGKQSYWAVRADDGRVIVTLLNDSNGATKKKVKLAGRELQLSAPPRAIVSFDADAREVERLALPY